MRWCLLGVLGLGIVSLTGTTAKEAAAPELKETRWLTDYDQAKKTARTSNKPIFVVFR
jgi:hypothetical protein